MWLWMSDSQRYHLNLCSGSIGATAVVLWNTGGYCHEYEHVLSWKNNDIYQILISLVLKDTKRSLKITKTVLLNLAERTREYYFVELLTCKINQKLWIDRVVFFNYIFKIMIIYMSWLIDY